MTCNFSAVDNCLQRFDKLTELIESGGSLVIDVAVDIEEGSGNQRNSKPKADLKASLKDYIAMDIDVKQWKKAAEKTKKTITELIRNESESERISELQFNDLFQEILGKIQTKEASQKIDDHPMSRQFTESICKIRKENEGSSMEATTADGEVLISQPMDNSTICPLTKAEMEDPVRNTTCGHSYSRKAVETHIKRMGGKARCPVVGCMNYITKSDLETNKSLDLTIKRKNKGH